MSGGHFEYTDERARNEIFGYSDKPYNVFEDLQISKLIWDVFELIHDFDWYMSGDTGETDYLDAKRKFKRKWLSKNPNLSKEIIDETIGNLRAELYKTFEVEDKDNDKD